MADNPVVNGGKPPPMTDEERLALCQKLDKELDEFIDGLEHKRYEDGWPEDRWEEEMDKHPFFMKQAPMDGEAMSPLTEGLAKLKYDPDENTPEELANNYKEDGNFNFKHKNYRLAILAYTEGIKTKCGNPNVEASLYNNRAAAHWYLSNFRSSLIDSERAFRDTFHKTACLRAIKCAMKVKDYDKSLKYCEVFLKEFPDHEEVLELRKEAKKLKVMKERDSRKLDRDERKKLELKLLTLKTVLDRGINIKGEKGKEIDLSVITPAEPYTENMVYLEDDQLWWPILFLYPEFQMIDFIKGCSELSRLSDTMEQLFPAPWDENKHYNLNTISVYYGRDNGKKYKVNIHKCISEILLEKNFELCFGTPTFFIVLNGSATEQKLLDGVSK